MNISPLAKRLAEENGLSLDLIKNPGKGPEGRIIERDILETLSEFMYAAPDQILKSFKGAEFFILFPEVQELIANKKVFNRLAHLWSLLASYGLERDIQEWAPRLYK
jgi:pyruvate/2-oxoglutarate dehydrogenase complex dihydrolipoamide acyltransferase (E2) component